MIIIDEMSIKQKNYVIKVLNKYKRKYKKYLRMTHLHDWNNKILKLIFLYFDVCSILLLKIETMYRNICYTRPEQNTEIEKLIH